MTGEGDRRGGGGWGGALQKKNLVPCSLILVSKPSRVVNRPPSVVALDPKSSDGILTSQVSD